MQLQVRDLALSTCYPPKVKGGEAEGVGAVRGVSCHLGRRSAWDGVLPLPRIQLLANARGGDGSSAPIYVRDPSWILGSWSAWPALAVQAFGE